MKQISCVVQGKSLEYVDDVERVTMSIPVVLPYNIEHHEVIAKDISRIELTSADKAIHYQAGQYIKVLHNNHLISPMSIACAPFDISKIELHLHHPIENTQALDLLHMIEMQKQLLLRGPYGTCTVSRIQQNRSLIFIANGTGLAPIKAIIEELLLEKTLPPIHLYWYAEDQSELYLQALVTEWMEKLSDFRYTPLSLPAIAQSVLRDYGNLSAHQIYMVDTVESTFSALDIFVQHGLDRDYFYSDVLDYDVSS